MVSLNRDDDRDFFGKYSCKIFGKLPFPCLVACNCCNLSMNVQPICVSAMKRARCMCGRLFFREKKRKSIYEFSLFPRDICICIRTLGGEKNRFAFSLFA